MMKVQWGVDWGPSRARIWLQSLPNWVTEQPEVTERRLVTETPGMSGPVSAAVEMVLPGPRCRYGALGATFVPKGSNTLILRVLHSATMGALVADSLLAGRIDVVHQGLLTEYVPGILDDAHTSATVTAALALGPGVLSFSCAAHGEIGSSIHYFGILARTVIGMLMREPASEAEAVALLRAEITRSASLP